MANEHGSHHPVLGAVHLGARVVLGVVLFVLLITLADRHNLRFDLTPTKEFTLSGEAQRVVAALKEDVHVSFFYDGQQQGLRKQFEEVLGLFAEGSPLFHYRLIDLDRSPREAARLGISGYNTGVIEAGERSRMLRGVDQETLVDAILRLTQMETPVLCFITGHGEHTPQETDDRRGYSKVAKALEKENYEIRTLDFIPPPTAKDAAPTPNAPRCTVMIVAGPQKDLLPNESDNLIQRLAAGDPALLMVEPFGPESVAKLLLRAGVRVFDDVIVDEQNRFFGTDPFVVQVPAFAQQVFGQSLSNAAVFSIARTVRPSDESELTAIGLPLAQTGDSSWGRLGDKELPAGDVQFRSDIDKRGPLPVAAVVRGKRDELGNPTGPAVGPLIVFGDSDFAANNFLDILGNRDLFLSSIAALVENTQLIAQRQQRNPEKFSPLYLQDDQMTVVRWIAVGVTPSVFAVLGILITWRRRRRASR